MRVRPLGDRVLVRVAVLPDVSRGGIIIPEVAKDRPLEGVVVATGPAVECMLVGDRVLFGKFAGTEVHLHGEPYLLLRAEELLGVLEP